MITAGHDMWIQAQAYGLSITIFMAELLQESNIIDVDGQTQLNCFINLLKTYTTGGIDNLPGLKTGLQTQLDFLD